MKTGALFERRDLPLQVVFLLLAGVTLLTSGGLLFLISGRGFPYYERGLYGVFLFVVALQIVILGETPFGNMDKSRILLVAGLFVAALGIVTCFIPGVFGELPRRLLFLCLTPGGLFMLLDMFFSPGKFRTWRLSGGIFRHLIYSCGAVYFFSVLVGLTFWRPFLLPVFLTAWGYLLYGGAILYLARVLYIIYGEYPEARSIHEKKGVLNPDHTMILVVGVFMILLGLVLIPVTFGVLPFSGSAQLGLLVVIFAVQMMAFGNTPLGPFPRSWLMISTGLFLVIMGVISCIIPDVLVSYLTILIGVLNVLGGSIMLVKALFPLCVAKKRGETPLPWILKKLYATQFLMNLFSILFGASMLVSQILAGYIVGIILAVNGVLLLYLLYILLIVEKMKAAVSG